MLAAGVGESPSIWTAVTTRSTRELRNSTLNTNLSHCGMLWLPTVSKIYVSLLFELFVLLNVAMSL